MKSIHWLDYYEKAEPETTNYVLTILVGFVIGLIIGYIGVR